jgi:pimeloyl-ACP methyl ester carboxylesterase
MRRAAWPLFLLAALWALPACEPEDTSGAQTGPVRDLSGGEDMGDPRADQGGEDAASDAASDLPDLGGPGEDAAGPGGDAADAPDATPPSCPEGWDTALEPGPVEINLGRPLEGAALPGCQVAQRFFVAASEMELSLSLTDLPPESVVEVASMRDEVLISALVNADRAAALRFTVPSSGEWRVRVYRPSGLEEGAWRGALTCEGGCDREATRYPIVLLHGMAGTDTYFGVLDYWYRIPAFLEARGYRVYVTVSDFIGHSERRAPQIAAQLDQILAETGAGRLHLIGHSQGGLDMRVLVSGLGYDAHAASMTSVGTPHLGLKTEVPEFLTGMNFGETYLRGEFVELYPDRAELPRFSWAGVTCPLLAFSCQRDHDGEVVSPIFALSYEVMRVAHYGDGMEGANDGLIPVSAAAWGEFLGVIPADHIDQVGQIADNREGPFDHLAFYLSEAQRLREVERSRPDLTPGR